MAPTPSRRLDVITPVGPAASPESLSHLESMCDSMAVQELPPGWEVRWFLHCDGSSPVEIMRLLERSPFITNVSSTSRSYGAATARNLALAAGDGEYVTCLDADDVLPENALTRRIEGLGSGAWWAGKALDLVDGELIDSHPLHELSGHAPPGRVRAWWNSLGHVPFHPATFITHRHHILEAGGWAAIPREEDIALILRITDRLPGEVGDVATLIYRKHPAQLTQNVTRDPIILNFIDASLRAENR